MFAFSRRRSFTVALGLSLLLHLGAALSFGSRRLAALLQPAPLALPQPRQVRFELVDTPKAAETKTPPAESRFMSNRNTRAQDNTPADDPTLRDQPKITEDGKSHDLRRVAKRPPSVEPAVQFPSAPPAPAAEPTPPVQASPPAPPSPPTPPAARPPRPKPAAQKRDAPPAPTQRDTAAVQVPAPARKTEREPDRAAPEPTPAPPAPPVPEVQPLPKKDPTRERFEVAKAERNLRALEEDAEAESGRPTLTRAEAEQLASARMQGEFSYGATKHFFGDYLLALKERVEQRWIARLVSEYSSVRHSRVVVDFKILASGEVTGLYVSGLEGDPYFKVICVHTIEDATPFPPVPYTEVEGLPPDLVNKPLNIRFTFEYN